MILKMNLGLRFTIMSSTQRVRRFRQNRRDEAEIDHLERLFPEEVESGNINQNLRNLPEMQVFDENVHSSRPRSRPYLQDSYGETIQTVGHDAIINVDQENVLEDLRNEMDSGINIFDDEVSDGFSVDSSDEEIDDFNEDGFNENMEVGEADEIRMIRTWVVCHKVNAVAVDALLLILRNRLLPQLPKCSKSLLKTSKAEYKIEPILDSKNEEQGEFVYIGIEKQIRQRINPNLHGNEIELIINIDGLKLFRSSTKELWPICCKIHSKKGLYKPFTIAAYYGVGKPGDPQKYFTKFIRELNLLLAQGIEIRNDLYLVKLKYFTCDFPARSFIKSVQSHVGFHACERCTVVGEKNDRTTVFLSIDEILRSLDDFLSFSEVEHHVGVSQLLGITPQIDFIKQFVLDPMHLVFLGAMSRLLQFWLVQTGPSKLSAGQRSELQRITMLVKKCIPEDRQEK